MGVDLDIQTLEDSFLSFSDSRRRCGLGGFAPHMVWGVRRACGSPQWGGHLPKDQRGREGAVAQRKRMSPQRSFGAETRGCKGGGTVPVRTKGHCP